MTPQLCTRIIKKVDDGFYRVVILYPSLIISTINDFLVHLNCICSAFNTFCRFALL
jgi:hypothetical protein